MDLLTIFMATPCGSTRRGLLGVVVAVLMASGCKTDPEIKHRKTTDDPYCANGGAETHEYVEPDDMLREIYLKKARTQAKADNCPLLEDVALANGGTRLSFTASRGPIPSKDNEVPVRACCPP